MYEIELDLWLKQFLEDRLDNLQCDSSSMKAAKVGGMKLAVKGILISHFGPELDLLISLFLGHLNGDQNGTAIGFSR